MAALCVAATPSAGTPVAARDVLQPMDLFGLGIATNPQISLDGALVAYVRSGNDVMIDDAHEAIWPVDARTGAQKPLTGAMGDTTQPRWSPDGKRFAFVAKPDGQPCGLYIHTLATGLTARVAVLERSASALSWSRDGSPSPS